MTLLGSEVFEAIEATAIAQFVKNDMWAYPILETVHIIGLGLLFGSIIAFDLRVLGLHKDLPLSRLGNHLLPWVWMGFLLNASSGLLLFSSDAIDFSTNQALWAKLGLIGLAGLNAAIFQVRIKPGSAAWDSNSSAPAAARTSAAVSILLWISIIVAGRMIAYVK